MYHLTKFGSERISKSEDIVEVSYFDHMSPCCDLDLENSKLIFLHDTPVHNNASQYHVW